LSESWEHKRAQAWAAEYERAQDCIRCPQRLLEPETREKAMPRNMWAAFQQNEKSFLHGEELLRQKAEKELGEFDNIRNSEWRILKDIQRTERAQFFADGKREFSELRNSIYQTVREEFRERWSDYYQNRRDGVDSDVLRELRQGIIADQKAALEPRRDAACKELRATRDAQYRDILDTQREQRQALNWHQDLGLDTSDFFHDLHNRRDASVIRGEFSETAHHLTQRHTRNGAEDRPGRDFARDAANVAERPLGAAGSFGASLLGSLILHFANLGSTQPEPVPKSKRDEEFRLGAEEETKHREKSARDLDDENGVKGQKFYTAANDRGGEPATFVSRETPATKETEADDAFELPEDELSGVAIAIELEFQGRLTDIRKMPRRDRPGARRAAVEWRREALKALAEKRCAIRGTQIAHLRALRARRRGYDLN
jgi:hypothetical protein